MTRRVSLILALCVLATGTAVPVARSTEPHAVGAGGGANLLSPVLVFVSIPPQRFVADGVGGDLVETHVLVAPGQSPHTFEPTPRQMVALAESDVYLTVGLPFEERILEKLADLNPDMLVVDTSRGVPRRPMDGPGGDHGSSHADATGGGHAHGEEDADISGDRAGLPDPHTWMSPVNVKVQAENACEALVRLRPDAHTELAANLEALSRELDALDAELAASLAPLAGQDVFVFHAAFGYFTDAYGLGQVAVESGGKTPGAKALAGLIERARAAGVRVVFVQPQFSTRSAEAIASEIGGVVVAIDPLSADYVENLRTTARRVAVAFGEDQ